MDMFFYPTKRMGENIFKFKNERWRRGGWTYLGRGVREGLAKKLLY